MYDYQKAFWEKIHQRVLGGKKAPGHFKDAVLAGMNHAGGSKALETEAKKDIWFKTWLKGYLSDSTQEQVWETWWLKQIEVTEVPPWYDFLAKPTKEELTQAFRQTMRLMEDWIVEEDSHAMAPMTRGDGFPSFSFFAKYSSGYFYEGFLQQVLQRAIVINQGGEVCEIFMPALLKQAKQYGIIPPGTSDHRAWVYNALTDKGIGKDTYTQEVFWPSHDWVNFALGMLRLQWWIKHVSTKIGFENFLCEKRGKLIGAYRKGLNTRNRHNVPGAPIFLAIMSSIHQGKYKEEGKFEQYCCKVAEGLGHRDREALRVKPISKTDIDIYNIEDDSSHVDEPSPDSVLLDNFTFLILGLLHFSAVREKKGKFSNYGKTLFLLLGGDEKPDNPSTINRDIIRMRKLFSNFEHIPRFFRKSDVKDSQITAFIKELGVLLKKEQMSDYDLKKALESLARWRQTFKHNSELDQQEINWFVNAQEPFIGAWQHVVAHLHEAISESNPPYIEELIEIIIQNPDSRQSLKFGTSLIALHATQVSITNVN